MKHRLRVALTNLWPELQKDIQASMRRAGVNKSERFTFGRIVEIVGPVAISRRIKKFFRRSGAARQFIRLPTADGDDFVNISILREFS